MAADQRQRAGDDARRTPTPANVEAAKAKAFGSLDFRLLGVLASHGADAHVGHKMQRAAWCGAPPRGIA